MNGTFLPWFNFLEISGFSGGGAGVPTRWFAAKIPLAKRADFSLLRARICRLERRNQANEPSGGGAVSRPQAPWLVFPHFLGGGAWDLGRDFSSSCVRSIARLDCSRTCFTQCGSKKRFGLKPTTIVRVLGGIACSTLGILCLRPSGRAIVSQFLASRYVSNARAVSWHFSSASILPLTSGEGGKWEGNSGGSYPILTPSKKPSYSSEFGTISVVFHQRTIGLRFTSINASGNSLDG